MWVQVLDDGLSLGSDGSLHHQHGPAGGGGELWPGHASPGVQEDPSPGRVEEEPRGLPQHLGSQLSVRFHLGSGILHV